MLHPEGGHILLNRHPEDAKGGICPSHPNCFEGFASGPSIDRCEKRERRPWS
ncbi:MAG: ROK family protein [Enterocloster sp.]